MDTHFTAHQYSAPKSSQWYVDHQTVDMFANMSVHEVAEQRSSTVTGERVIEPQEDHKYTVRVPKLTLSERLMILLGDSVPVEIVDEYTTLALENFEHGLTAEELRLQRAWIMDQEDEWKGKMAPDPKEQKKQADELVLKFKRVHNPDLIEAIKSIPPNEELRIMIPGDYNLSQWQRQELATVVLNYLATKYPRKPVAKSKSEVESE